MLMRCHICYSFIYQAITQCRCQLEKRLIFYYICMGHEQKQQQQQNRQTKMFREIKISQRIYWKSGQAEMNVHKRNKICFYSTLWTQNGLVFIFLGINRHTQQRKNHTQLMTVGEIVIYNHFPYICCCEGYDHVPESGPD